jgi:hypothetical protein
MKEGEVKEKYILLIKKHSNGFLKELEEMALSYGEIIITPVSNTEIKIEGKNEKLTKLFTWLLGKYKLKNKNEKGMIVHLKPDTQNPS